MPLRDVPRQLPVRANGRRLHISAVYRWTMRGLRGVVLETVKVGGTTYTSREALQRFAERLSEKDGACSSPRLSAVPTTRARERQLESANRRVMQELGPDRPRIAGCRNTASRESA